MQNYQYPKEIEKLSKKAVPVASKPPGLKLETLAKFAVDSVGKSLS